MELGRPKEGGEKRESKGRKRIKPIEILVSVELGTERATAGIRRKPGNPGTKENRFGGRAKSDQRHQQRFEGKGQSQKRRMRD